MLTVTRGGYTSLWQRCFPWKGDRPTSRRRLPSLNAGSPCRASGVYSRLPRLPPTPPTAAPTHDRTQLTLPPPAPRSLLSRFPLVPARAIDVPKSSLMRRWDSSHFVLAEDDAVLYWYARTQTTPELATVHTDRVEARRPPRYRTEDDLAIGRPHQGRLSIAGATLRRRFEHGRTCMLSISNSQHTLHLRAAPRQSETGPLDDVLDTWTAALTGALTPPPHPTPPHPTPHPNPTRSETPPTALAARSLPLNAATIC